MDWNEVIVVCLLILAVGILVFLNGFFVAAEFALVKLRGTQLEPLVSKGYRRARMVRHILNNLDAYLSACQLGITLASLALGYVGHPIFDKLLGPVYDWRVNGAPLLEDQHWRHMISIGVGFMVITVLHLVVGEQAPKWLAIQRPLPTSLRGWRPLFPYRLQSFHAISSAIIITIFGLLAAKSASKTSHKSMVVPMN